jgi:uncharacterized damage-inducible protein DinB
MHGSSKTGWMRAALHLALESALAGGRQQRQPEQNGEALHMETIRRMMDHLYWANARLLEALQEKGASRDALVLMRHIVIAEKLWLLRLQGQSSAGWSLWDESDFDWLAAQIASNEQEYRQYIAGLAEERLDDVIEYKNQSQQTFHTSIRDILTHVALHGQYHRGQINRILRAETDNPTPVDYIAYVRLQSPRA